MQDDRTRIEKLKRLVGDRLQTIKDIRTPSNTTRSTWLRDLLPIFAIVAMVFLFVVFVGIVQKMAPSFGSEFIDGDILAFASFAMLILGVVALVKVASRRD